MRVTSILASLFFAFSASHLAAAVTYTAVLTGGQDGNNSTAIGRGTFTLNDAQTTLTINITYNGLSSAPVTAQIQRGAAGQIGPTISPFPAAASPIALTLNIGLGDVADFLNGNFYVNITSSNFPNGEIRGQILPSIRVKCGGGAYTDSLGQNWMADNGFSLPSSTYSVNSPISGTPDPYLYQSERWSSSAFQYLFTMPNGNYTVNLKFAEIFLILPGQRIFNVNVNGSPALTNFDVLGAAGRADASLDLHFAAKVSKGSILIEFNPVLSNPKISAIEIVPQDIFVDVTPRVADTSGSRQFTATVSGTTNTAVNWTTGQGTIDTTGLYSVTGTSPYVTTVTAASAADPTRTVQATVNANTSWLPLTASPPTSITTGAYSVTSIGDIYGTQDTFQMLYRAKPLVGDGAIIARVNTIYSPNYSKAGLMLRQSTDANSPHVFVSLYAGVLALLESRSTAGGSTSVQFGSAGSYWLRLVRTGNTFTGYVSDDGVFWVPVGAPVQVALPSSLLVGLAASSGYGSLPPVIFDNVQVTSPVAVSLADTLVSLAPDQQAAFTALVTGTANQAVTWTISPGAQGSITVGGVYQAPNPIPFPETATVTATSVADPTRSASSVVQLGFFNPIRVNAGGPSHIDPLGLFWSADTGYDQGLSFSAPIAPSNSATPYLYQSEHFNPGPFQYKFNVPNALYQVNLKFDEIFFSQAGQRVFNVSINGTPVLTNFDIVAAAGGANRALDRLFSVNVTTGNITIAFTPASVGMTPKINAIEITQVIQPGQPSR